MICFISFSAFPCGTFSVALCLVPFLSHILRWENVLIYIFRLYKGFEYCGGSFGD